MKATRSQHQIVIRQGWGSAIILPATAENMEAFNKIFSSNHIFKSISYKEYVAGDSDDYPTVEIVPTSTVEQWLTAGKARKEGDEAKAKASEQANYLIENEVA